MKKIVSLAVIAIAFVLTSCNKEKEFSVHCTFNIPEMIEFGDTIIPRGDLNGIQVYLCDLSKSIMDSVVVENDEFFYSGKCREDAPYFLTVACDYGVATVVVQPGNIEISFGDTGDFSISGTPYNDAIDEMTRQMYEMEKELNDIQWKLYAELPKATTDEDRQELIARYQEPFSELVDRMNSQIDSVYQVNSENLVGVYAAYILTANAEGSDELEEMLTEYSDYVKESELMQERLKFLREYESMMEQEEETQDVE